MRRLPAGVELSAEGEGREGRGGDLCASEGLPECPAGAARLREVWAETEESPKLGPAAPLPCPCPQGGSGGQHPFLGHPGGLRGWGRGRGSPQARGCLREGRWPGSAPSRQRRPPVQTPSLPWVFGVLASHPPSPGTSAISLLCWPFALRSLHPTGGGVPPDFPAQAKLQKLPTLGSSAQVSSLLGH